MSNETTTGVRDLGLGEPPGAIARQITEIVAEIVEKTVPEIWAVRDQHLFEELRLDSLLALEIVAAIEKRFKIEIPEERLEDITTLSKTIALTTSLLQGQVARQAD